MSDIIYFKPKSELTGEQNYNAFIEHCRDNLTLYNEQGGWEVNNWYHQQKKRRIAITFSQYRETSNPANFDPLLEPFLSFAKAYMRYTQSMKPVSSVALKLVALRCFHDALIEVHRVADVLKTDGLVIGKIDELLRERVKNLDRLNKVGYEVGILFDFIRKDKMFLPALPRWKNPFKKIKEKSKRTDKKSRKWQDERCPSMHQMLAIADAFSKAETKEDKYWTSILVFLMFAPGRAGELSDLTVDCLHRAENGALAVRWYAEKGFGHTLKWVPKDLETTVIQAHERLVEIGKPARDAAKFAYDNPNVFFRHKHCVTPKNFPEDEPLDAYQFAYAMNFTQATVDRMTEKTTNYNLITAWNVLGAHQTKWIKELREDGNPSYKDLANYVAKEYKDNDWPNLPSVDRPIWEALALIRDNEFHKEFEAKRFSWVLPDVNQLNNQLSPRNGLENPVETLFQRMGYADEDGSPISLSSHQLRVWISTNAERGGMDAWQLAQWAGRAKISDNRHYDLRTSEEREQTQRRILRRKTRPTALEAIKEKLPVSYEDLGVHRIGIADVTQWGMCVHDFAQSPCTKAGGSDCMTCKEHVCIKGMPKTLERIKRLESQLTEQYEKAQAAASDGTYGADLWVTHLGWKLGHVRTQRIILESEDTPEGAVLWIPPEHDPSPVSRALEQKGYNTTINRHDLVEESTIKLMLGNDDA
ncbi:hypothetical protein [Endozoicomonas sp. ONNA2]|uniref:hypothetical protein n=1 Tax=Endozoicomonas sp. ONNA2 TaxID=2828741 RepID=UPI002147C70A|nr:hypothetical protein [Endozoicomonas sp. ONNA2]